MKNIRIFYLKNCRFLVVKFSVYLNRRVFAMLLFFFVCVSVVSYVAFVLSLFVTYLEFVTFPDYFH